LSEKKEARIQQFLAMLQRAIGVPPPATVSRQKGRSNHRR
jgi:hypothetical protein